MFHKHLFYCTYICIFKTVMKTIYFLAIILFCKISLVAEKPSQINYNLPYDNRSDTIDIIHTIVNLNFGNYTDRKIIVHSILKCKSKINGLNSFNLDLRGLTIDSIKTNHINSLYTLNSQSIIINSPITFNINDSFDIEFFYHGTPYLDFTDFGGFYWSNNYAYNVGVSFKELQHSYGRTWLPCLDNFVERCTYEYFITTDTTRKAFCGGNLISQNNNLDGTVTWHWYNNQNIPSYLASVAVAKYSTVSDTFNGKERIIPIEIGVLAVDTNRLKASFTNLNNALRIFENSYGVYKFDRVGYSITDYNGGAMEHACNITYPSFAINGTLSYETLMAHELSHHWWGDLVTCENASEMWLNEGWAVYSEKLFTEGLYGKQSYMNSVRDNHAEVLQFAHISDSGYHALSNVPLKFTYGSTSYNKGSDIAHTLRSYMGDTMFFRVIKDYMSAKSFSSVKSVDFSNFITGNSTFNAANFFNDWVFEPGFPQFSIDYSNYTPGELKLWINQKLNHAPHYYNQVPIEITLFDQNFNKETFTIVISGKCTEVSLNINYLPAYIAIDLDQKISDAIIDESLVIKNIGIKNLTNAKLVYDCKRVGADSIFLRVEHNYVAPEPMKNKISGLHLHNYRYWNIDGIYNDDSTIANITFNYNGTNSLSNGYLDNEFITNSEDSLVMMYRKNGFDDWQIADSFKIFANTVTSDKLGKIIVYNAKKGQYCFAIYDFRYLDTTSQIADDCFSLNTEEPLIYSNKLNIFPNPASNQLTILLPKIMLNSTIRIYNINSQLITEYKNCLDSNFTIDTKLIDNGVYLIKCFNENNVYTAKFEINK